VTADQAERSVDHAAGTTDLHFVESHAELPARQTRSRWIASTVPLADRPEAEYEERAT
jgi:hypothetical protein